jgi:DNA-binding NarL/FixJ family response regulator
MKLGEQPDFDIAGVARDEEDARLLVARERPAVLVFDYEGLGPSSELAIRRLRRAGRGTRILVLATRSGVETLERVLRAGAAGLVGKAQPFATLVRAIRAVAAGELWANRVAAAHVIEHLAAPAPAAAQLDERLTHREWQIVEAVGQGIRNREIAKRLKISEKTVKSHLNNIFRKLRVDNRFAVGLYSLERAKRKA